VFVEHAIGSLENPMSDRMIEDKFLGLVEVSCRRKGARDHRCVLALDALADAGRSRGMAAGT